MSNVADTSPLVPSLRRGVVCGLAAGVAAGLVWYLIVLGTSSMQTYLIPAFGVVVAYGVYFGARRAGGASAVVSVVVTLVTLMLAMYYVERHLVIRLFAENGDALEIPLVPYLDWLVEVLHHAFTKSVSPPVYSLLALVAAGWFGFQGFDPQQQQHRRPG